MSLVINVNEHSFKKKFFTNFFKVVICKIFTTRNASNSNVNVIRNTEIRNRTVLTYQVKFFVVKHQSAQKKHSMH